MADWWTAAPEVERPAAPPRPTNRTSPVAQALAGPAPATPTPQQPSGGGGGWWDSAPVVEAPAAAPAAPPTREVGFLESAGRTAASSATPVVRALGLADAGVLEIVKQVATVADAVAPIFGLRSQLTQRVQEAQDEAFAAANERAASMRAMYDPQAGEEMSLPGQIAGGIASMPIEMVGGMGLQRGVERSADVLQRGGSGGEAALSGAAVGAVNVAANLLPIKAGGKAVQAVERVAAPLAGKTAARMGVGAVTGGALGAGADAAVTATENATLPEGEAFEDLKREAAPGVAGGLGAALGALGGVRAPRAAPKAKPAAKPTPGTPGSAGAAGTDVATQRRERAAQQGIDLTKGQAERSFEQQRFERETAKDSEQGGPLRERAADQNERMLKRFDELVEETGGQEVDPGAAGRKIVDPILKKAERAKQEIRTAYDDARAVGDMDDPIDYQPIREFIEEQGPTAQDKLAPVLKMVDEQLARNDPDGSGSVPINALEDVRKAIRKAIEPGTPNEKYGTDLIRLIDQATEGKGGELYKHARKLYRDYAAEFKNQGAIRDLIHLKRGTTDRKVAYEDVVRKTVTTGSVDDLNNVKRTLTSAGDDGLQAWREVQGQAMRWINDEATKNVARDVRGNAIVSPAKLAAAVRALDKEGKLEILFGKKGAETLRDLDDIAKDLFTAPPGAVNTSNAASVVKEAVKWMTDSAVSLATTGVPVPLVMGGKALLRARTDRKVRGQVKEALGDGKPVTPLFGRVIEQPVAAPVPPPKIPTGLAREIDMSGRAPLLRKLPVPDAKEGGPGDIAAAVVEQAKKPVKPLPAGEARELDDIELNEWAREFGLGSEARAEALRIDRALQQDAAAVERAAVQHAKQPTAFARAIDRILDKAQPDETVTPASREGSEGLPGARRSEEGGRQGEPVGQDGTRAAAQAQEVADEASGAAPPAPGQPFLALRLGSTGSLDNRNAGNADALASFLGRLDDIERPQPKGAERSDTITVFRATVDEPFGAYQRGTQGRLEGAGKQVGRIAEKFGTSYSFPAGGAWKAEPVAKIAVKDLLDDVEAAHGVRSFDDIGGLETARILRERVRKTLANVPPDTGAQQEVARARAAFDKDTQPTGNPITDALSERLRSDYKGAVAEYATLKDSHGGTVLNTDVARELSPDYLKDRTRSADVHEPASAFIKRLYAERLAAPTPAGHERRVLFTAGGTGAGKTTAVAGLAGKGQPAELTYDTNMNGMASAVQKIDQALQAGREVRIAYVYADPLQAFEQAMSRAMNQKGNFGSGRTVPIVEHVRTHVGVSKVIRDIADRYRNDLRVDFKFIDNSRGRGNAAEVGDLREIPLVGDNGLREKLEAAAQEAHRSGRIDDATLAGFLGQPVERPAAQLEGVGQGVRRRPEPQSARAEVTPPAPPAPSLQGATGATTTVVTERGLRVPVRYRLVEADALTTSHSDDLKPNAAFPAEFQPRDRTRDASEAQIARIENGLQPELLADGPKASDGAPIVGPDGLVESGNARTIALRRAYGSGKAEGYREYLASNAERFGLTAEQVRAAKRPVLVRERTVDVDRADFARQANESAVSAMSEAEQAQADAKQLPDLEELVTNDDGTVNIFRSTDFIREFMRYVASPNERGQLMTADGRLSQRGVQRIRNAVFAKAYGDPELVASMAEATDGNVRNVMAGLLRAAPSVAKVRELSEAGARGDVAFVPDLVEAVRRFSELREAGQRVDEYLSQGSLIGGEASPRVADLLRQLELDSRAPRRVADMVERMADEIDAGGDPRQANLLEPGERD
jgi:hypothetical protein